VPSISKHRTIETARVRLSPEVDPKRARTQRLAMPQVPHRGQVLGFAGLVTVLILGGTVLVTHFGEPIEEDVTPAPRAHSTVETPAPKGPVNVTVRAARPNLTAPVGPKTTESVEQAAASEQTAAAPKRVRRPSKDLWLE
jgi:hypothetical protein